jgi:hypothetical protein
LVSTAWPVKVPDGFGGGGGGAWVVGGGVYAGALVFVAVAFGLADLVADGLVVGGFIVGFIVGVGVALGDADGVTGGLNAVTVGTWVLYENSAASPATVPPRARTARRI